MPGRELIDHEAAHGGGVVDRDVDEEVVGAAEEEQLDHVGVPPDLLGEGADALVPLAGPEGHADDGLQSAPQAALIDRSVEAGDEPAIDEPADAGAASAGDAG